MKALAVGLALLAASCVLKVPSPPSLRLCTYLEIRPDSVVLMSYVPPCDMSHRPAVDTIHTYRMKNEHPSCPLTGVVDEAKGEAHLRWIDCEDRPGPLRRIDAPVRT